ncbi:MAG: hypothetical protein A49_03620 [Methyloceanibacter sp.]|nr:MAG: hypothetical protein A49_03620 [Methyloceanibacter sp.]
MAENIGLYRGAAEIDSLTEEAREAAIICAMMDPPLVEVDGPHVVLTDAGRKVANPGDRQ